MFPPRSPQPALLAAVRAGLARVGYAEAALVERIGCRSLHDVPLGNPLVCNPEPADALGVVMKLLLEVQAVPRALAAAFVPEDLLHALEALDVVAPADGDTVAASVALYPVEGLYIVSDPPMELSRLRPDAVYPAISASSRTYLGAVPRTPCRDVLEVCSGTGTAALVAARAAQRVWAVDITARSTDFARFNAALNGIDNVTPLQGDLFEPVRGRRFDRILAHPPYVPALSQRAIYRDAGVDGEELTRRIVAEAPGLLEPGGRLYCSCVATERTNGPLELRVREMLGPASDEIDVLVLWTGQIDPLVHFARELSGHRLDCDEFDRFLHLFREMNITHLLGATIVLERHAGPRPPLTLRRQCTGPAVAAVDAVLTWEGFEAAPADLTRLAATRPRLAARARLQVTHTPDASGWALERCRIVVDAPLVVEMEVSPHAAAVLSWCDGERTVQDHLDRLRDTGAAPDGVPIEAFAPVVLMLLKKGVVEAELPG